MKKVGFYKTEPIPLEFHRVKVVQRAFLPTLEERLEELERAQYNTYHLDSSKVFLDMLTDSGTNAMNDEQLAASLRADDAFGTSASFTRFCKVINDVMHKPYVIPVHQGRAAEHVIAKVMVKPGDVVPMNYHFCSAAYHIKACGGTPVELVHDNAFEIHSNNPFKGNVDLKKLDACIAEYGPERIPFIRMECSTNLIGGQPFSMENFRQVKKRAKAAGIPIVLDTCLLSENLYMIQQREPAYARCSLRDIANEMFDMANIIYFSARKLSCSRAGGAICCSDLALHTKFQDIAASFEGFITFGGVANRDIETMSAGLYEAFDEEVVSQGPRLISYVVENACAYGIPMVTPPGALGAHIDALQFCPQVDRKEFPSCSLAAAFYLISGIRTMDNGSAADGRDVLHNDFNDMELVRMAFPRRYFTYSQALYALDRLKWLWDHRQLIGGSEYVPLEGVGHGSRSPMRPIGPWPQTLAAAFRASFPDAR